MNFPFKPCMVCKKTLSSGLIVVDNFADKIDPSRYGFNEKKTRFIDTVTFEYFEQFGGKKSYNSHFYKNDPNKDNSVYRLDKVLNAVNNDLDGPDHYLKLFLLAHENCLPVNVSKNLVLNRADCYITGDFLPESLYKKINEFNDSIKTEVWYNPLGWKRVLKHLYDPKLFN